MTDLSEKEQLEALRSWWSEYGTSIIGGVVIAVAGIFGWNQWQSSKAAGQVAASTLFEDIMEAAARGNLDAAVIASDELFSKYTKTAYAAQGRLAMARMYMDNGRDQDAANVLQALVDTDKDSEISLVARHRLAKILLYQDKPQAVIDLVRDYRNGAFAARFNEVMGDAYVALGSFAEAEAAYVAAMNDNPLARTVDVGLIRLKLNDLPLVTGVATEAPQGSGAATMESGAAPEVPAEDAGTGEPATEEAPEESADLESDAEAQGSE